MGTTTQVAPTHFTGLSVHVVIHRQFDATNFHDVCAAVASNQSQLVGLVRKFGDSLILRDDPATELLAGFCNGDCLFLDGFEVLGREGFRHIELVIEAIGDRRSNAELGVGKKFLHRLRRHVGAGVTQDGQALVAIDGDGLDVVLGRHISGEVTYFSVDPCGHDRSVGTQDVKGGLGHPTLLGLEFGLLLVSVGDTGFEPVTSRV